MGIIRKQAIQSTIISYLGIAIGYLNTGLLLPAFFTAEEAGHLFFFNSLTSIFATIASVGIPIITVKMFPYFRSEKDGHNGYFGFIAVASIVSILLGIAVFITFKDHLISEKNDAATMFLFPLLFCIAFSFRVIFKNFDAYIRMLYDTVTGLLLESLLLKVFILLILVSYFILGGYDFKWIYLLHAITLSLSGAFLVVYIFKFKTSINLVRFKELARQHRKSIYLVGFFGVVANLGGIAILEIDRIMVSNLLGLDATGIYSIAFFLGIVVNIPARGIRRIASTVISNAWKENDTQVIQTIYKKSSINQFLIAGFIFLSIWSCCDYAFEFMRPEFRTGKWVFLIIGIAQLVDMVTGVNGEVIATSKYYRYNSYFVMLLIVLVVPLNYLLIPIWGIEGAAIASLIAMFVNNALRYLFLLKKFSFQPFSIQTLMISALISLMFFSIQFFPTFDQPIIGAIVTLSILSPVYWGIAYYLKFSEDLNEMIEKVVRRLIRRS